MTKKEFLTYIQTQKIESKYVSAVEKRYATSFPNLIKRIISCANESLFFDDEWRVLSVEEIIDAPEDLHVDFIALNILPLIDTDNNDFIVYHSMDACWSKFNIVDECFFQYCKHFEEYFEI